MLTLSAVGAELVEELEEVEVLEGAAELEELAATAAVKNQPPEGYNKKSRENCLCKLKKHTLFFFPQRGL